MESKEPEELIVISDLHLSAGRHPRTGKWSRNEDFFFDEEFARFLQHIKDPKKDEEENDKKNKNENGGKKNLIIAGDMFDFLQVTPDPADYDKCSELKGITKPEMTKREKDYGFGTKADETVWKLAIIAAGHQVFFRALANFLIDGHRLSIITGNHDVELYWPKVQSQLIDQLVLRRVLDAETNEKNAADAKTNEKNAADAKTNKKGTGDAKTIKEHVSFHPWFYYDKTYKTYVEHGNQYDCFNSFEYFLHPLAGPKSDVLWLPIGSLFVRYCFNKVEMRNPFADNIKPFTKYIKQAWKDDKLLCIKSVFRLVATITEVYAKSGKVSENMKADPEQKNQEAYKTCEEENEGKLVKLAKSFGRGPAAVKVVKHIYALRTTPFTKHKAVDTCLCILACSTLFVILAIVTVIVLLMADIISGSLFRYSRYSLILSVLPVIKWFPGLFRGRHFDSVLNTMKRLTDRIGIDVIVKRFLETRPGKHVVKFFKKDHSENALEIKKCLGDKVETVIFGHTHDPERKPDRKDAKTEDKKFKYFNVGTWTTVFSEEEKIIREEKQFAFVSIKKEDGKLHRELYRWNDSLQRPAPLRLFELPPKEDGPIVWIIRALFWTGKAAPKATIWTIKAIPRTLYLIMTFIPKALVWMARRTRRASST